MNDGDDNSNTEQSTVCEMHRMKAFGMGYQCNRCECYLTQQEKLQYKQYVSLAEDAEKAEDFPSTVQHLLDALTICNQDAYLNQKLMVLGDNLNLW